jgi:hypothetical protein
MFNVTRNLSAPPSLAAQIRYDSTDVLKALKSIFLDKCYLCESKNPHSINVEHFDPHKGSVSKKFDWNNLFYACGRCNGIKSATHTNLLNCTDATADIARAVKHLPPRSPAGKVEIYAMDTDPRTLATVNLLEQIYNSDTKSFNKQLTAVYLRKAIYKKVLRFLELVHEYYDDETPLGDKAAALTRMQRFMDSDQEYSAFLRWIVLEDSELNSLLGHYIP